MPRQLSFVPPNKKEYFKFYKPLALQTTWYSNPTILKPFKYNFIKKSLQFNSDDKDKY